MARTSSTKTSKQRYGFVVATRPAILRWWISAKTTDEGNNSFRSCSKNTNPDHSARVPPIHSQSRHSPSKVIADIQQWQINGLTVSSVTGGSWARQWGKKGVAQTLLAQSGRTAIFFIQAGESKSLGCLRKEVSPTRHITEGPSSKPAPPQSAIASDLGIDQTTTSDAL